MTAEQLDRVWDPFEQGDTFTSKKYGGTGLGLSLIKELVKALAGQITMTSSLGVGTTITIRFPLSRP
jgi:signal transduction histidine kinase